MCVLPVNAAAERAGRDKLIVARLSGLYPHDAAFDPDTFSVLVVPHRVEIIEILFAGDQFPIEPLQPFRNALEFFSPA